MPDREKVIKDLEDYEPYAKVFTNLTVKGQVILDALSLLKEQEPVKPEVEVLNEVDRIYRCPKCHKCFFYEKQKFCDQCGQVVSGDE